MNAYLHVQRRIMKSILLLICILIYAQTFAQNNLIQRRPALPQAALKNDLIEFEVPVSQEIMRKVAQFVDYNQKDGLNPYDPEQIDIQAVFYHKKGAEWQRVSKTFGFYYQDFQRDTSGAKENWSWRKKGIGRFLIRYSPNEIGEWKVEVSSKINSRVSLDNFEHLFTCIPSDKPGKMYVQGRRFYIEDKAHLPIGVNLSHPKWTGDTNTVRAGTAEYAYEIRKLPAYPIAYLDFQKNIEQFAQAGGNYFRYMHFPYVNDIEFETLNDYSKRLHIAWESDQIMEKCDELGVRMHYVLTWACELNEKERTYNKLYWDWWANDYPWVDDDYGYCYQHTLGLKEPHEFITNPTAIHFYKKKLRYMFARWGYSRAIGTIELMNEINYVFADYPVERMKWQAEISRYIKEDLEISAPISVNYGGKPDIKAGDESYYLPTVDVITFNEYRTPSERSNFIEIQKRYEHIERPFMFSEIGAGSGELADCEKWSEWMKDAWMTSLSGMAAMGLEWTQQRNFKLMSRVFPVIDSFIHTIQLENYTEIQSDIRMDKKAEVIAIKDLNNRKAVGVVQNTTWNFFTNRQSEDSYCAEKKPKKRFQEYSDVRDKMGWNALHLKGFKRGKHYRIEWIDAQDGSTITSTEDKASLTGKVRIRIPDLTKEHALLVFKMQEI